jgi:hypothetical protein
METAIQELQFINSRITIDSHSAGQPVLAELLKAFHNLVAPGLARGKIDGCTIDGNGKARAFAALPRED